MQKTTLICNNFSGINRTFSVFSPSVITASDMQNVELFSTGTNEGVGIRTAKGNVSVCNLIPQDEIVIGIFESIQQQTSYFFVYTENTTEGKIYLFNIQSKTLTEKVSGLTVTGKACGCDISQGWADLFVFSNGEEILSIELNHYNTDAELDEVTMMEPVDADGRSVKGLGLVSFAGRLWIFSNQVLWYSVQEDIYDFSTSEAGISTSAGYIEFVKNITAIYPYLGTLAVFHSDSSCLLSEQSGIFSKTMESPGGCAGYKSLVFHGTELYFYDDTKKGVFCFRQIVNGDKTLGENIALDIQEELCNISALELSKIKALSVVTSDRNEVWFMMPSQGGYSLILIYDYIRKSWVKRKSQKINCIAVIAGVLYSAGETIYEEYSGESFNGEYIPAFYKAAPLNLGRENSLKALNFGPKVTLDMYYKNNFYVEYTKNYDDLTLKCRQVTTKTKNGALYFDIGNWDESYFSEKDINSIKKLPVSYFKTLQLTFLTKSAGEDFCIKNIEFEKIKVKTL